MNNWRLWILVAAAAFFLFTLVNYTQADVYEGDLKNVHASNNKLLHQVVEDADDWWVSTGSPRPAAVQLYLYDETDEWVGARGDMPGNRVYFPRSELKELKYQLREGDAEVRRYVLRNLWCTIAHERGHNLGYNHDAGGIMDSHLGYAVDYCPGRSIDWARKVAGKDG